MEKIMKENKKIAKAAAWKKQTKAGNDYYSVSVTFADGSQEWVNLFWNKKGNDKHPDYRTIEEKTEIVEKKDDGGIPF